MQHTLCNLVGVPCVKFRFYADDVRYSDRFAFDNFDIRDVIDVGVSAHISPKYQGCLHTDQTAVTVQVYNGSCSNVTDIPMVCDITGVLTQTLIDTMRTSVPPSGFLNFTFGETIDMLAVGDYTFTSYTDVATEPIRANDTTIYGAVNVPHTLIDALPYIEDFNVDSGEGTWLPKGGNAGNYWEWGNVPYLGGEDSRHLSNSIH